MPAVVLNQNQWRDNVDKRDIDEANAILEFCYRELTWKDWAWLAVAGLVIYIFVTGLVQILSW